MSIKKNWFIYLSIIILAVIFISNGAGKKQDGKTETIEMKVTDHTKAGTVQTEDQPTDKVSIATPAPVESVNTSQQLNEGGKSTSSEPSSISKTEEPVPTATNKPIEEKQVKVESTPSPEPPAIIPNAVDEKIQSIAKADVTVNDYAEIIKILTGKLSMGEIKYLFDSARGDYWETTSVEDIEKARGILFSKLSDDDIARLSELGKKLGRSMDILKKDIDVAETKEGQMRSKGLIE